MTKLENFEKAFSGNAGSCSATCPCGRKFYNSMGGWTFEEGELDRLQADPKATDLDYAVGYVEFEGSLYCVDCDCWHPRAKQIMGFLDTHAREIAEYLTLEKKRKTEEAEASPVVGG